MLHFILRIALMVLTLLIVVPAVTGNKVAVRQGGFFRDGDEQLTPRQNLLIVAAIITFETHH